MTESWDVFICHTSEDKEGFVRPLAETLRKLGVSVWYDEFSLKPGDSLSKSIDKGIAGSNFGIVVISPAFIGNAWADHELRGLVNRDVEEDLKILPIWHGVSKTVVMEFSPPLADKWAIDTRKDDAQEAAIKLLRMVRPDLYDAHPRAELEKLASGEAFLELQAKIDELREQITEYQCPYCSAALATRIDAPVDPEERDWDLIETYECGYQTFGGEIQYPCPSDPKFPKFEEYDLVFDSLSDDHRGKWSCSARPKTMMARKVQLRAGYGKTKKEAKRKFEADYLYQAGQITNMQWIQILFGASN